MLTTSKRTKNSTKQKNNPNFGMKFSNFQSLTEMATECLLCPSVAYKKEYRIF